VIGIPGEGHVMRMPRFRLRTLMIAIAVLAVLFAACALSLQAINRSLLAFYGPGGPIDRRNQFFERAAAGSEALRLGNFRQSETCFKAALKQVESDREVDDLTGGWYNVPPVLVGLADALSGQRRFSEAEALYKQAMDMQARKLGADDTRLAETLEQYGASLERAGRTAESMERLRRAEAIRARALAKSSSKIGTP
jgi:tetratricopeptide (TPR) repeat protein